MKRSTLTIGFATGLIVAFGQMVALGGCQPQTMGYYPGPVPLNKLNNVYFGKFEEDSQTLWQRFPSGTQYWHQTSQSGDCPPSGTLDGYSWDIQMNSQSHPGVGYIKINSKNASTWNSAFVTHTSIAIWDGPWYSFPEVPSGDYYKINDPTSNGDLYVSFDLRVLSASSNQHAFIRAAIPTAIVADPGEGESTRYLEIDLFNHGGTHGDETFGTDTAWESWRIWDAGPTSELREIKLDQLEVGSWKRYTINISEAARMFFSGITDEWYFRGTYIALEFSKGVEMEIEIDNFHLTEGAPFLFDFAESANGGAIGSSTNLTPSNDHGNMIDGSDTTYFLSNTFSFSPSTPGIVEMELRGREWANTFRLKTAASRVVEDADVHVWDELRSEWHPEPVLKLRGNAYTEIEKPFSPVETSKLQLRVFKVTNRTVNPPTSTNRVQIYSVCTYWGASSSVLGDVARDCYGADITSNKSENSSNPISNMIDGSVGSTGQVTSTASSGNPVYFTVDLGSLRRVNSVTLKTDTGWPAVIKDFTVYSGDYDFSYDSGVDTPLAVVTGNTGHEVTAHFSSILTREIVLMVTRCEHPSTGSPQWVTIGEIVAERLPYVLPPEIEEYAVASNGATVWSNVGHDSTHTKNNLIDGDPYSHALFTSVPSGSSPVVVEVDFGKLREINYFTFATDPDWCGTSVDYEIWAVDAKDCTSCSQGWRLLKSVTGNTFYQRAHSLPTIQTRRMAIVIFKQEEPSPVKSGCSGGQWVDFRFWNAYSLDNWLADR